MATNLGVRPSNAPLPHGYGFWKPGGGNAAPAWPPAQNFLYPGDGTGGDTQVFNRPERFWLHAGANVMNGSNVGGWTRYDYGLKLVVNGAYGNDLNGVGFTQKAHSNESHGGTWLMTSIEALFYCEANTNYIVYLVSLGGGGNMLYYQYFTHYNLWAYTIGEGVY
jgi:hypothetical protein